MTNRPYASDSRILPALCLAIVAFCLPLSAPAQSPNAPPPSSPAQNLPRSTRSLEAIAREYFEAHANQDVAQEEITAHIRSLRPDAQDPWRTVRKLYQDGYLIKVRKGVYRREPGHQGQAADEHFTEAVRKQIYERDHFHCIVCGNGPHNGHELHADHIKPRQLGGLSTPENGQTLCSECNLLKKTYGIYDFYAHLVVRLEEKARAAKDAKHIEMLAKIRRILRENGYPSTNKPPQLEDEK